MAVPGEIRWPSVGTSHGRPWGLRVAASGEKSVTVDTPAQAHAVLGAARQVFMVPVPGAGALVVADPGAFLSGAPASVARLFDPTAPRPLSLVAGGAGEKAPCPAHAAAEPYPTRKEPS